MTPEENEIEQKMFATKKLYEKSLMKDIQYILGKVSTRCHSSSHAKCADALIEGKDLFEVRQKLFEFTS